LLFLILSIVFTTKTLFWQLHEASKDIYHITWPLKIYHFYLWTADIKNLLASAILSLIFVKKELQRWIVLIHWVPHWSHWMIKKIPRWYIKYFGLSKIGNIIFILHNIILGYTIDYFMCQDNPSHFAGVLFCKDDWIDELTKINCVELI
jgi:hypothetical protein